jgi:UDP-N-acetylmuramate: L-alanyl-gamma-D-glutamyl-meso-diaminopimelate ligase
MAKKKHIHFIGVGGSAIASIAIAFSKAGYKVTGSEAGPVYPPMSGLLQKNKIDYYFPFDKNKVGSPDEIVIGNAHYSDTNPEVVYARENKIELEHFPRLLEKYLIKKNSIVVAGTYAKTTMTSMLTFLLTEADKDPSFMIGGSPVNFESGARLNNNSWSVVEGDEYTSASPWDFSPKFDFYHPKYLLLSSAEWDHYDIYKTKKSYVDTFKKLVKNMPSDGLIVAKLEGKNIFEVLEEAKCRIVFYSTSSEKKIKIPEEFQNSKLYFLSSEEIDKAQINFSVSVGQEIDFYKSKTLGDLNVENWCGVIAMAREIKIKKEAVQDAVQKFGGVKRRLEVRSKKNNVIIIDDFAHNPSKARGAVQGVRKHFLDSKLLVIFEPNRGGRSKKCLAKYSDVFDEADIVLIPELHEYKKKKGVVDIDGQQLADQIKKTNKQSFYMPDWNKMKKKILFEMKSGGVVLFMGPSNFDKLIRDLKKDI